MGKEYVNSQIQVVAIFIEHLRYYLQNTTPGENKNWSTNDLRYWNLDLHASHSYSTVYVRGGIAQEQKY